MSPVRPAVRTFGAGRRWMGRLDLLVSLVLSLYVLILVNVAIFRRPMRLDLTRDRIYTLSPATLDLLRLVREEVVVAIPTYLQRGNPMHEAQREVLARARALLNQYVAAQPLIRIGAEVDVIAQPSRWIEVSGRFNLSGGQFNRFIFLAGPAMEFRQDVTPAEMATFQESRDPVLGRPEIKDFHAEKAMTDAIGRLIQRQRRIVYFTQDKGEYVLKPQAEKQVNPMGLNALASDLRTYGIEARPLSLGLVRAIPDDCQALAMVGPVRRYTATEIDLLRRYVREGGRLLVALEQAHTGIEALLEEHGVKVLEGTIRGLQIGRFSRTATELVGIHTFSSQHPITRAFRDLQQFEMVLHAPRPLAGVGMEKGWQPANLLETDPGTPEESFYLIRDNRPGDQPRAGSFPVAIAVEQLVPERPPPGFQRVDTRIVVVGAANFLDDDLFQGAHRDFFMNSMAWILQEEEKASVSAEAWTQSMLPMNPSTRRFLFWVPVGLLPATFLAFAAFIYFLRRA